jgi:hypothetical protein
VQHQVCIVLAARAPSKNRDVPARLQYVALPKGEREKKFEALAKLALGGAGWKSAASGWRQPFLPEASGAWATFPLVGDFFVWAGSGVTPHRTWPIAPDVQTLERRWEILTNERDPDRQEKLFHPDRDRTTTKKVKLDLGPYPVPAVTVAEDQGKVVQPVRYAFRSFDRQWLPPDNRLLSMQRPQLWDSFSAKQVYLTALEHTSPKVGPAITLTDLVPNLDHYNGRGGRVYPLWRDRTATQPNIKPALLMHLANVYARAVKAEDVMAYLGAVMAQPAFTTRFKADLIRPGLRVPLTADAKLFAEAVALGSEVVWLHSYGERFADPKSSRPKRPPRLPEESAPRIPAEGAIPSTPEPLPDSMEYDPATRRLKVGNGYVENVTPEIWAYEVSGKQVLWHWFSYRRRDRSRPIIGDRRPPSPLEQIQPDGCLPEYTTDLLDLLHVLGRLIALEPQQADLLDRIGASRLLSVEELRAAGALAMPNRPWRGEERQSPSQAPCDTGKNSPHGSRRQESSPMIHVIRQPKRVIHDLSPPRRPIPGRRTARAVRR